MFADPEARRFFPEMFERKAAERWVERQIARFAESGYGLWVLEKRHGGGFVGDSGLTWQDVEGESILEVGYHVTSSERNHGFATEAAAACLQYGFEVLGADRIVSIVHIENAASRRVAGQVHSRLWKEVDRRGGRHQVYVTETPASVVAG